MVPLAQIRLGPQPWFEQQAWLAPPQATHITLPVQIALGAQAPPVQHCWPTNPQPPQLPIMQVSPALQLVPLQQGSAAAPHSHRGGPPSAPPTQTPFKQFPTNMSWAHAPMVQRSRVHSFPSLQPAHAPPPRPQKSSSLPS